MALMNLNRKLENNGRSSIALNRHKNKKGLIIRLFLILIVLIVAIYLPARSIYLSAKQLKTDSQVLNTGIKQANFEQIKLGVKQTSDSISSIDGSLNWLFWLRIIPYFGGFYSDAKHFSSAARAEMKAAKEIVEEIEPYQNELGLTGQATAGQDQVALGVKILDKILPKMDKIEPHLKKAREEVSSIDTSKYPEKIGGKKLKSYIEIAKNFIIGADIAISENRAALEVAPNALGQMQPKTYLLLFQNDKELRATGGFMTAYAFLKIDKGHLTTTSSDDIYRLDEKLLNVCKSKICPLSPPAPIVKYLPEVTGKPRSAWSMRDSNLSPDLPSSIRQFEKMYEFLGEGLPFDGIITIDTQVVEELIKITGPVEVNGTSYSASTDKRCNCPNVIYELEHYAEVASKGQADRKEVLGTLMQQILARSLGAGPEKMPDFINAVITLAGDKHIMFFMHDQKTQAALSKLNWTGEIKSTDGDYIHINDSNFAGGKSNLYVEEKVTYDIKVDGSGNAKNKVTIEYKNPQPYNIWLNGILRDYVRIYLPKGSQLVSSKGSEDPVGTAQDDTLNKTYFDAFIQVRPQNSRTLSFEYTLPNRIQTKSYPLLIQKQPGAKDHRYVIKINGNKKAEFDLTSDKQLNLSF